MTLSVETLAHNELKHLPLHEWHIAHNAKLMSFGVWEVPAYYTGILDEHRCVRENVGLFDISHMGQILVEGPNAALDIDGWITNSIAKLENGKALYSLVCNERGGVIDDIIVYQITGTQFLIIVNAANIAKDFQWFNSHRSPNTSIKNLSDDMAMFALQGPRSKVVALKVLGGAIEKIKRFHFLHSTYKSEALWALRTGYTGEDGYEFLAPMKTATALWHDIMTAGGSIKIQPIGFGARDTLRLEAAYRLHGQDMDETTTPLEAGLAWTVDLNKKFFIGQEALKKQKASGLSKVLAGFSMNDRAAARHGYEIFSEGKNIGHVTGGSFAPTLNKSIGLGYVESSYAKPGKEISIKIRDNEHHAKIEKLPFFKKELAE